MRQLLLIFLFLSISFYSIAQINIPDPEFLQLLIDQGVDTNGDGEIQLAEAESVTELISESYSISDFEGIQFFINIERLLVRDNVSAHLIDISNLSKLRVADFSYSDIMTIDARGLASLDSLTCQDCFNLFTIDLVGASELKVLDLSYTQINDFDFTGLTSLEEFSCVDCMNLFTIDLQEASSLKSLILEGSSLEELNLMGLENLEILDCELCSYLRDLNLSEATELKQLKISHAFDLSELDVTQNLNLELLVCEFTQVEVLEVSNLTNLITLTCGNNNLLELDVGNLVNLEHLDCSFNHSFTELDVSNLNELIILQCNSLDSIGFLDVADKTKLEILECSSNNILELEVGNLINLNRLDCSFNSISELNVENLNNLEVLKCNGNIISNLDLAELSILKTLDISRNQFSVIDIASNPLIRWFSCSNNTISELDLSVQDSLDFLSCASNALSNVDIAHLNILRQYDCSNNVMINLDIPPLPDLEWLSCGQESLINLRVTNLPWLMSLEASVFPKGNMSNAEIANCPFLTDIQLENLSLTSLDISTLIAGPFVNLRNNELQSLFIKNGAYDLLDIEGNEALSFICADENELDNLRVLLDNIGLENALLSTYCPHTNSGQPYVVSGDISFDADMNGCDVIDLTLPYQKFEISDGTNIGAFVSNATGNYSINVHEGSHTITPILENPSLYTIEPESVTIDFPSTSSPFLQDFCITPIGSKDDVTISIIPVEEARPGFDTKYKLIYKNNGNSIQSGIIRFSYPRAFMDIVNTNPEFDMESGDLLFWNYQDLRPFEQREIFITMGLNSPMDDPPLNGDDVLSFIASITMTDGSDIKPNDNQHVFRQIVVNSFDPNDKTCLEGSRLEPELVGEFVSYMIRFENTGTAEAVNIVVRDSIDPIAFDISTLVPVDASHTMRTQITGDIVEFIFQNIYLPFDDANNDGYIVFKVKTRDHLVIGDVLENTAGIYFDYNFPIITNTTTTTIDITDDLNDVVYDESIEVHPNPATNHLYISASSNLNIIQLYDLSGMLVYEFTIQDRMRNLSMDLPSLASGMYLLIVYTDNGKLSRKLVIQQ